MFLLFPNDVTAALCARARIGVRELLALIDTAKENRRWEFLIYQYAQGEEDGQEPQREAATGRSSCRLRDFAIGACNENSESLSLFFEYD